MLADFVNGNNVRMLEPGSRSSFTLKAFHRGISRQKTGT